MANQYYNNTRSFTPGTASDGNAVDDKFDAISAGIDSVDLNIQRAIKLPAGTPDQTIVQDAAGRADKGLGFDANGNLTLHPSASAGAAAALASEGSASTSAANAATSETNAGTSATNAAASETNAAASAASVNRGSANGTASLDVNAEVIELPAGAAAAVTGTILQQDGAWVAPAVTDTSVIESNIALNSFRIAVNGSLSKLNMVDGFVDEYGDETGIDLPTSSNQSFLQAENLYSSLPLSNLIPAMTGLNTPSGIITSSVISWALSSESGPFKNPPVVGLYETVTGAWVAYQFPVPQVIVQYKLSTDSPASSAPRDFTFEGWSGSAWVVLDTQTGTSWVSQVVRTFDITNTVAYIKYRLNVQAIVAASSIMRINSFEMLGRGSVAVDIILVSNPVTAVTQPTTASLVVLEEDVDAVTLNTDLNAAVSRDGGTTWSNAILSNKGAYSSSTTSIGTFNLIPNMTSSTAPSGTVVVHRSDTGTILNGFFSSFNSTLGGFTNLQAAANFNGYGTVGYIFPSPEVINVYSFGLIPGQPAVLMEDWTFEGSNDGTTWVVLDTKINQGTAMSSGILTHRISNTTTYTHYQLRFTRGGNLVGRVTMGSQTPSSNSPRTLTASADLSTQPAGTSMQYKLTTANTKRLKLHGTALSWK